MKVSGAEALCSVANSFVGQIVAQRLHKKKLPIPYDEYVDLKSIDTKTGKMEYFTKEESESSSYFSSLFKKKPKK